MVTGHLISCQIPVIYFNIVFFMFGEGGRGEADTVQGPLSKTLIHLKRQRRRGDGEWI